MKKERLYYNLDLIDRLKCYLEQNPSMRFSQALLNLGLVNMEECIPYEQHQAWTDEFYLESSELHKRVLEVTEND